MLRLSSSLSFCSAEWANTSLSGSVLCPGQMILLCQTGVRTPHTNGTLLPFSSHHVFLCHREDFSRSGHFPPRRCWCRNVCLPVRLSVCFSACLSVGLAAFLSVCRSVCLPVFLSVCPSVCLFFLFCLSVCRSVGRSVYLSICLSVFLFAYTFLPAFMSVRLSVCFVCLSSFC